MKPLGAEHEATRIIARAQPPAPWHSPFTSFYSINLSYYQHHEASYKHIMFWLNSTTYISQRSEVVCSSDVCASILALKIDKFVLLKHLKRIR
jgi:hypothetical protein